MLLFKNDLKLKFFEIKYKYNTYFSTIILVIQINLLLFDACNTTNDVYENITNSLKPFHM